jgi:flagellar hook-associated protein 2
MIQAYNYMVESLPVSREVRYPVSKRSDLKKIYSRIINLSKESPLYKINLSKENQEFAIGIKEAAIALRSKISDIQTSDDSGFHTKTVFVSDERILSAELTKDEIETLPENMTMKVYTLANSQRNRGKDLLHASRALPIGEYQFEVNIMDQNYQLIFSQKERENNLQTMKRMAEYLNQQIPELSAVVEEGNSPNYSHITITTDQSGRIGDKRFSFEDTDNFHQSIVEFFGLDRIEQEAAYAQFDLNDTGKQIATNTFSLENTLRITLHKSDEEHPINLRIVPDSSKILSSVESVLSIYNQLIGIAKNRTQDSKEYFQANKLTGEMKSLERIYKEELDSCGIVASDDGSLTLEDGLAVQAAIDGGMESLFTRKNGFIASLLDKAVAIAINPMDYLDKTVVTYPNTNKMTYHNPYVTSMYSGLFFNSYC